VCGRLEPKDMQEDEATSSMSGSSITL
jgi:hypothetical protein